MSRSQLARMLSVRPIGQVQSWYNAKNGTPRQANICPESRATIQLNREFFANPGHAIADLPQFSHLW